MNNLADFAGVVRLPGPLTIRHAAEHRDALMTALASHREITLALPADAEADISFVQLLLATQVSARASGKRISLRHEPAGALLQVIERGGFAAADQTGFWIKGTHSQ